MTLNEFQVDFGQQSSCIYKVSKRRTCCTLDIKSITTGSRQSHLFIKGVPTRIELHVIQSTKTKWPQSCFKPKLKGLEEIMAVHFFIREKEMHRSVKKKFLISTIDLILSQIHAKNLKINYLLEYKKKVQCQCKIFIGIHRELRFFVGSFSYRNPSICEMSTGSSQDQGLKPRKILTD